MGQDAFGDARRERGSGGGRGFGEADRWEEGGL
jgi:hypothetical protein